MGEKLPMYHEGKLVHEFDRSAEPPNFGNILKRLSEKNLVPKGRKAAVQLGMELRPLEQLRQTEEFKGSVLKTKSFPSGTVKGNR